MYCRKLKYLFLLLLLFLIFPKHAIADDNFKTNYNVVYSLTDSPLTHVTMNASIQNKTTQYSISQYNLQMGFSDIENVKVVDPNSQDTPIVTKNEKGTQIGINFDKLVLGIGNTRNFVISFDTSEIAQNSGNIWEVNIPGIEKDSTIDEFNVAINFPQNLGDFAYIKPDSGNLKFSGNTISFNRNDIGDSGLSLAFGDYQVYKFSLVYHLQNSNVFPVHQQIALPPSTNYQDVEISNINPTPQNIFKDPDGNWMASYLVPPSKKVDVVAKGDVRVYLSPRKEDLSQAQAQDYLKQQPYWDVNDPKIQALAKQLKTPQNIYKYVVGNLSYDFSRVNNNQQRLGASKVLNDPTSAVCLEFSDLFVALSRAAGIPAREINGFAYTQNSKERPLSLAEDVLHAWPEYYDFNKKEWIMVDPTWGNTTHGIDFFNTLDFDHVAFVIQGLDSSSPVPAGGYKTQSDLNKKDVNVTIEKTFPQISQEIQLESEFDDKYTSGVPITGAIRVRNNGNVISDSSSIIVTSDISPTVQNLKINQIPPFGYIDIPVSYDPTSILTNKDQNIKIQLGNQAFYLSFSIRPFFYNKWVYIGGILIGILITGLLVYFARSRRLSSQKS